MGAAWGAPIAEVEVQIDGGPWRPATLGERGHGTRATRRFAWRFWTLDWGRPAPASTRSRRGRSTSTATVQPAPDDPLIASKLTYWESNGQITRRVAIT